MARMSTLEPWGREGRSARRHGRSWFQMLEDLEGVAKEGLVICWYCSWRAEALEKPVGVRGARWGGRLSFAAGVGISAGCAAAFGLIGVVKSSSILSVRDFLVMGSSDDCVDTDDSGSDLESRKRLPNAESATGFTCDGFALCDGKSALTPGSVMAATAATCFSECIDSSVPGTVDLKLTEPSIESAMSS